MSIEDAVIEHYRHGALEDALLKGLAAAGKDVANLTPDDLAPAEPHRRTQQTRPSRCATSRSGTESCLPCRRSSS